MEIQYYDPSQGYNKAIYLKILDILILPFGTDKETEKEIIDYFKEVNRCIDKWFYFYMNKKSKISTF